MTTKNHFTPIKGAANYALGASGYVYNVKTKHRLKRHWIANRWHTTLRTDDGRCIRLPHDNPDARTLSLPSDTYVPVPDFPDYVVTPYGAVWKVNNLRGPRSRHPFMVTEYFHRKNRPYVRLRDKRGRQCHVPVSRIMDRCFPKP
jgi:hypothetical protein